MHSRLIPEHGSIGNWNKYYENEVDNEISKRLGDGISLQEALNKIEKSNQILQYNLCKSKFLSIVAILITRKNDIFLEEQYKIVEKRELLSVHDIIKAHNPNLTFSKDSLAISQGLKTPRHIEHLSKALYYNQYINAFQTLESTIKETHNHISQEIIFL